MALPSLRPEGAPIPKTAQVVCRSCGKPIVQFNPRFTDGISFLLTLHKDQTGHGASEFSVQSAESAIEINATFGETPDRKGVAFIMSLRSK